jgi:hypothetical protein
MAAQPYECPDAPYIFHVEHCYSVVHTYDPSPPWNQHLLLQEQKLSGVGEKRKKKRKAMLQCPIHIPFR